MLSIAVLVCATASCVICKEPNVVYQTCIAPNGESLLLFWPGGAMGGTWEYSREEWRDCGCPCEWFDTYWDAQERGEIPVPRCSPKADVALPELPGGATRYCRTANGRAVSFVRNGGTYRYLAELRAPEICLCPCAWVQDVLRQQARAQPPLPACPDKAKWPWESSSPPMSISPSTPQRAPAPSDR